MSKTDNRERFRSYRSTQRWGLNCVVFSWLVLLAQVAFAYRTDFGLLGDANVCADHPPVTLQVPLNSQPVPNPLFGQYSGGFFHVEEIADGLFYATEGAHQLMFLISDDGIMVVDAPPGIGLNAQDFQSSVSIVDVIFSVPEAQGKEIEKLIYSHSHMDHIGAASQIQDAFPDVEIIAHRETKEQIELGRGLGPFVPGAQGPPPVPETTFKQRKRVRLGHQVLELSYMGPIHEPGNIFIYAPNQKVLMVVDLMLAGTTQFRNLALAEDVPFFVKGHDLALEFDFDVFLGGHINRLGTRADVEESKTYLDDLLANSMAALADPSLLAIFNVIVPPNPPFQPFPAPLGAVNGLAAVTIFLDQASCRCANLTLDPQTTPSGVDWTQRLAVSDLLTVTHCFSIIEALRDDPSF